MLPILFLFSIFILGFFAGYGARAWRSHKRRERYLAYSPSSAGSHARGFGHARRAF